MKSQYSYIIEFHLLQLRCHVLCCRALQFCNKNVLGYVYVWVCALDSRVDFPILIWICLTFATNTSRTMYTHCGFVSIINEKLMMLQNYGKYTLRISQNVRLFIRPIRRSLFASSNSFVPSSSLAYEIFLLVTTHSEWHLGHIQAHNEWNISYEWHFKYDNGYRLRLLWTLHPA